MTRKKVNPETSRIEWTGKMVGGKQSGSIKIKDGHLEFDDNELKGGEVIIDMHTLTSEDLKGKRKKQLEDHLHSDDFFSTHVHKISSLKINEVNKDNGFYKILGDLKIKGKSNPIELDLNINDKSASSQFEINRAKYNIKYASKSFFKKLGDNVINDNFFLDIDLKF